MEFDFDKKTGVYVHIPFCRSRCVYCAFCSSVDEYLQKDYCRALVREIDERVCGEVDSVYIGGGTPSVLERGLITEILSAVRSRANVYKDSEITVEANPDSCTDEFLDEIVSAGVTRLSLGVQSLNSDVLSRAGRRHDSDGARKAVRRALSHGLKNISCDLMIGLEGQTQSDIIRAVEELSYLGVKHISLYALSVEEGTPLYARGYSVDADCAADDYAAAYEKLKECGFERYEVSNFCKNGKFSRHNFGYWLRAPYIGVGASAHSFDGLIRSYNTSNIASYINGDREESRATVTKSEALEEYIMLGLRTARGIKFSELNALGGEYWAEKKHAEIDELSSRGFIEKTADGIRICENAYYVMNEIIVKLI